MQAQIEDLQARIAFQEQAIESLSHTVHQQGELISALSAKVRALQDALTDMQSSIRGPAGSEPPPPHY